MEAVLESTANVSIFTIYKRILFIINFLMSELYINTSLA